MKAEDQYNIIKNHVRENFGKFSTFRQIFGCDVSHLRVEKKITEHSLNCSFLEIFGKDKLTVEEASNKLNTFFDKNTFKNIDIQLYNNGFKVYRIYMILEEHHELIKRLDSYLRKAIDEVTEERKEQEDYELYLELKKRFEK